MSAIFLYLIFLNYIRMRYIYVIQEYSFHLPVRCQSMDVIILYVRNVNPQEDPHIAVFQDAQISLCIQTPLFNVRTPKGGFNNLNSEMTEYYLSVADTEVYKLLVCYASHAL